MGLKDVNSVYKQIHNNPSCEKTKHSCWKTLGGLTTAWAIWYCVGPDEWEGWCIGREESLGNYWGGIFYSETTAECPTSTLPKMDWKYTANNSNGDLTHIKVFDVEDWNWKKGLAPKF